MFAFVWKGTARGVHHLHHNKNKNTLPDLLISMFLFFFYCYCFYSWSMGGEVQITKNTENDSQPQ